MYVLGTAGHVDHGKSSLLRALSGMEPDRLPEEKKRGMTIDLNFVWIPSSNGHPIGIVDVPGHQRFVKNMISGTMTVDAFLFVVAADDGWMPQSEEHLQVLKSLGVTSGIGILSKVDLVSPERALEVEEMVQSKLKEAFGKNFPISYFSNLYPKNAEDLRLKIENLLSELPAPRDIGAGRLWVDRVFTPRGMGCVATGTLREGELREGDEVQILPSGKVAVIKTLQSYQCSVTEAKPVSRVALQLSKIQKEDIARGCLIQKGRKVPLTRAVGARIQYFSPEKVKNRELSFHIGTRRELALIVHVGEASTPNAFFSKIKFKSDLPLRCGDRFILRTAGEERTLGAGVITDPTPVRIAHRPALELLREWDETVAGFVRYQLKKQSHIDLQQAACESIFSIGELEKLIVGSSLYREISGKVFVEAFEWKRWREEVKVAFFENYAKLREPVTEGGLFRGLKSLSKITRQALMESLVSDSEFVREGRGYLYTSVLKAVDPAEEALKKRVRQWMQTQMGPVQLKEMGTEGERLKKNVWKWVKEGELVSLGDDYFVEATKFEAFKSKVAQHLKQKGQATTSELREFLAMSRKISVLVLEKLDEQRVTYLKDGVRRLLSDLR